MHRGRSYSLAEGETSETRWELVTHVTGETIDLSDLFIKSQYHGNVHFLVVLKWMRASLDHHAFVADIDGLELDELRLDVASVIRDHPDFRDRRIPSLATFVIGIRRDNRPVVY